MHDKEKSKEAKKYLKQAYRLNELINSHANELQNLRAMSECIPGASDFDKVRVQGGLLPGDRGVSEIIIKIVDLENQIQTELSDLVTLKKKIHDVIRAVPDRNEQLVLRCMYIEFYTWSETARIMRYSEKQVQRIHGNALQNVVIPKDDVKCP